MYRMVNLIIWALILPNLSAAFQVSSLGVSTTPSLRRRDKIAVRTISKSSYCVSKLASTASSEEQQDISSPPVDYDALIKYHAAIAIQMSLFVVGLTALDTLVDTTGTTVPFPVIAALFYGLSLKSRVFNPLNNARPNVPKPGGSNEQQQSSPGFQDRVMPSWTPPGVVFPIMWILIIGPLRAYSSALVVESAGHFLNPPTIAFLFHLSVGDVWNTINNTERRYGASVTGVLCVVASLLSAAIQYYNVDPLAGNLLGLTVIWLSVATSLITATWQLNPVTGAGERDALYPVKGQAETEFVWFQSNENSSSSNA